MNDNTKIKDERLYVGGRLINMGVDLFALKLERPDLLQGVSLNDLQKEALMDAAKYWLHCFFKEGAPREVLLQYMFESGFFDRGGIGALSLDDIEISIPDHIKQVAQDIRQGADNA